MQHISPQKLREKYIRELNGSANSTIRASELAEDLFSLDLTVYSRNFTFKSIIYNAFATSEIDDNISLHPEQLHFLSLIRENRAVILSAPTSFGKTFCIFEYIGRYKPKNVVLIVPTLALVDEYLKKIIKKYKDVFSQYKVHTNISEEKIYNFEINNIFILTHDRVVQETYYGKIEKIDFLVIDEVYKLETDTNNDRVLVLNMAYNYLAQKAKKYVLLAPFIKNIIDIEELEKKPVFYSSNYSPVVNDVKVIEILNEKDRFKESSRILKSLNQEEKTLIYFPTVNLLNKYIKEVISLEPKLDFINNEIQFFINWAKEEIHEDWSLITALERGYLIHNGQIPIGTRLLQLDYFETNDVYNRLLCTSTLLEGVNTTAKNIIITKPSRMSNKPGDNFTAFDFYNLVGRTGRLYNHYIGNAFYVKSPNDPEYKREDAVKSIRFEITDDSMDIDIQKGNIEKHQDFLQFLEKLNMTKEDYLENIGVKLRFNTVKELYNNYVHNKTNLLGQLEYLYSHTRAGKLHLVQILYEICEKQNRKLESYLINNLLNKQRPRIKKVVDDTKKYYKSASIDYLIATAIKLKMSYIEHTFYNKVLIIKYFMIRENVKKELVEVLENKILNTIEYLYYSNAKQKKMLLDIGIYERDVEKIIKVIGNDFEDTYELKQRLSDKFIELKNISYISKYIIRNLI